ncbi:hypothetical protein [Quatrionicoccus australiensis]|uniref:hypothetical protein n=1 Tax=Quatrionicoccus australiensis TaxID=138118 RepID=UPI001CF91B8A|nr:hypothetical protein [Quatrionicoccus australiensis]UCV16067.1 hypothetical protein KI612_05020 [Quatrionicoccus australiensis]
MFGSARPQTGTSRITVITGFAGICMKASANRGTLSVWNYRKDKLLNPDSAVFGGGCCTMQLCNWREQA